MKWEKALFRHDLNDKRGETAAKYTPGHEDADHDEDADTDVLGHGGSAHKVVCQQRAHDDLRHDHLGTARVQQLLCAQKGTR